MKKNSLALVLLLAIASFTVKAQGNCIEASHHYEGHPKPNVYVVTVFNSCDDVRVVVVKIVDAIYGGEVRREEFPMKPGETRAVRIEYTGDKYFSYEVSNHPPD